MGGNKGDSPLGLGAVTGAGKEEVWGSDSFLGSIAKLCASSFSCSCLGIDDMAR